LVDVPVAKSVRDMAQWFTFPDWSRLFDAPVFRAAVTVAVVATLETLVNLDAIDQLDPQQRKTPPSRELVAQGVGNTLAGLLGAIPMTCVVARSSINIHAGAQTKASTLVHGVFLFGSVALMPNVIN